MTITIADLRRSFSGHKVLDGVNLEIPSGELVGLIGPSGGGKSVMLKAIAGLDQQIEGQILGVDPSRVALMFQEGALFDSFSAADNVAFPLVQGRVPIAQLPDDERDNVYGRVIDALTRVGLRDAAHKMPGQLSGGMKRRLSLARALVVRPEVLLLDDPTAGLDPVSAKVIMNLIAAQHAEYRPTTIIVSHDLRRLLPVVERVVGLFAGRIAFDGSVQALTVDAPTDVRRFVACRFDAGQEVRAGS